jgi:hypothetical protein
VTTPPAAVAQGKDRTVFWGVLGIIVGLICCGILGIVFGALSLRDAGRYGNSKVLGWVAIAISVLGMIGNGTLIATGNYPGLS